MMEVNAWVEKVSIPTYKVGSPEKNPMFLEKRVYQGSSGVVYPHAVIEHIEDEKSDVEYTAVYLENEYLKIMVLPELGGRIQRAYDKVRNRDFVYYNEVVKPALVGLTGPWISGGIEFNWPQHHRPSTYNPVDFTIEVNDDGSKTVWVNETEIMFRTKGMAGFTLHPGKAYLEIKGRLYNPTPFPQTFLWWANPAVKVNEHYQSVFPPDVYAVFDHGKRDVSDFPIATGTYYKVDYSPGTDISRYDTIPVPTSYMAIKSKYDFIGCYEHDTQGGMLHVANHHFSPGKKQWTWGNGDFGYAWDRNLTDENGPYIELMTGVYTDNQPDFSWLQPNETKTFEQYFMPYAYVGVVKNATKEAMLNVSFGSGEITIKVYVTSVYNNLTIEIVNKGTVVKEYSCSLSPANIFEETYANSAIGDPGDWKVIVKNSRGEELVSYQKEELQTSTPPSPATPAQLPAQIEQIEDLYLNGLHLEQYRHATYNPIDYYQEALRRSPGDIRCNNAMGLLLLRRGQFDKSIPFFRTAIETLTKRNPNPYDGETYYNLGCALKFQMKLQDAYDAFYKATWNDAWQHNSYLALARIAALQCKWNDALALVGKSLVRSYDSNSARHLKSAILRKLGRSDETLVVTRESLELDPFNFGCLFEAYQVYLSKKEDRQANEAINKLVLLLRGDVNNYLELSLTYANAGMYQEAIDLLDIYAKEHTISSPAPWYYLGWLYNNLGSAKASSEYYSKAAAIEAGNWFPNKLEEIIILKDALSYNSNDAKANYYLGNLWYDKRQYSEAIECWTKAVEADNNFATPYRNLSLAFYNKLQEPQKAKEYLEKAFSLDPSDARVLMELDQLYKILGKGFEERLEFLEANLQLVNKRDDLYLERVTLYNNLQQYEMAKALLAQRKFHPWEGGEGKVVAQFLTCHLELAKNALYNKQYQNAIELLACIEKYPENLGEGKLYGAQENDVFYLLGCAYEGLAMNDQATELFEKATLGISEPAQAIFYNDPQPDKIIYQALAWEKLGQPGKAKEIFERFISFGAKHINDKVAIDYFAVSLPDMLVFDVDLDLKNKIHCTYLIGLGYWGLGENEKAKNYLNKVLELDVNHQGAAIYFNMLLHSEEQNASAVNTSTH